MVSELQVLGFWTAGPSVEFSERYDLGWHYRFFGSEPLNAVLYSLHPRSNSGAVPRATSSARVPPFRPSLTLRPRTQSSQFHKPKLLSS